MNEIKIVKITTVDLGLRYLLRGQFNFFSNKGYSMYGISNPGAAIDGLLKNEKFTFIPVKMSREISPFKDIATLIDLYKAIKKIKPQIIHTHTFKASIYGMIVGKIAKVPIRIYNVDGNRQETLTGLKRFILHKLEKIGFSNATHIWPNSKSVCDYIVNNKLCPLHKVTIIGKGSSNGVDMEKFDTDNIDPHFLEIAKTQLSYNSDNVYLIVIGRLVKDKGINEMVKAFTLLNQKHVNLKLILLGHYEGYLDPIDPSTHQIIKENESIYHIEFSENVECYLKLSNFYIHPSYREGFANTILEAGAMKVPIIGSSCTGNVDIIEHNINGLMFKKMDVNDIYEKIDYAINNQALMKSYANVMYDYIKNNFEKKVFYEQLNNEYLKLLKTNTII